MTGFAPNSAREGQVRSAFTTILERFCESTLGAIAAGLVDEGGESVDLAQLPVLADGRLPAYDVKLVGAHWQLVIRDACAQLGGVRELWIYTEIFGFVVRMLHEGYVLVLVCRPEAMAAVSRRAIRQVEIELCQEAGWPVPDPEQICWRRVQVRTGHGGPVALRHAQPTTALGSAVEAPWEDRIEILGPAAPDSGFEKGFRLLIAGRHEVVLVREPSGFWYAGTPA